MQLFGSLKSEKDESWVRATTEVSYHTRFIYARSETKYYPTALITYNKAALSVAEGENDLGVFFCWSGTGASMAANKVRGIRAALCSGQIVSLVST